MLRILKITTIGIISLSIIVFANENNNSQPKIQQQQTPIQYQEPTTGVEIIFSSNSTDWDKIIANAESELLFGDRRDVRQATQKAILRAKANIAKFLKEKVNSSETMDEMTKTLSENKIEDNNTSMSTSRKTIEVMTTKISNSADAILKGVIILEQHVNKKEKYVSVKVGMSRKTMKTADSMSDAINQDLSKLNYKNNNEETEDDSNKKNEIRRSKNYNNF
jgi:hypothetical protein